MISFCISIFLTPLVVCAFYPVLKLYQLSGYRLNEFLKGLKHINFANKTPVKYTPRMIRFYCLFSVVNFIFNLMYFYYLWDIWYTLLYVVIFIPVTLLILIVSHMLIKPFEILININYLNKAKEKLSKLKLIKIGITGSYGKTSTKNILTQILSQKYKVCASPASFNTPTGLSRTVLEKLEEDDEVIIIEMGARHIGDINYLCKICQPDYGIITSIGNCHLETFKTIDNIVNTKFELCENVNNRCVINEISAKQLSLKESSKKLIVGKEGSYAYYKDITYGENGLSFTMILNGKKIDCETELMGRHNLNNIICACALAKLLGVADIDIQKAVKQLKPTPHRLEYIKTPVFNILDDSYNCNNVGAMEALEVLSKFEGKKYIITPGMVELGKVQYEENYKLGVRIGEVCDVVIISSLINEKAIKEGLKKSGFNFKHLFFEKDLQKAMQIIKSGANKRDTILFLNDLPDNFK